MKRNYIKWAFACLPLLLTMSCTKNFLDKNPQDVVVLSWNTPADALSNLAGCYSTLTNSYFGYGRVYLDCLTDNAYEQFNYNNITDMGLGIGAPTSGAPNTVWQTAYTGISSCNIFLQNIPGVEMDASLKSQYVGEVRFLRALFYLDLADFFGDVVLYTSPPDLANAKVPRTSKDSILMLINSDLDSAIDVLPNTPYTGHAVKGSALALKARVALYQGQWQVAADNASQLMQSALFSLYPDYAGLFFARNKVNNPEILFSTGYQTPTNSNNMDGEIGSYAAIDPYQEMADAYEMTNGKPITDPASGYNPAAPYANRDPRLAASIKVPGIVWHNPDGSVFNVTDRSPTGFQMIKYIDTTLLPFSAANDPRVNDQDFIHLRYADVLLMYAEARNELSGPDATIYTALNAIRQRVGMPVVDQALYNTQSSLRDFIRQERRIELAFEGLRFFDLLRWQTATTVMPAVHNPGGITVKFDSHNYLWPIPQQEIYANPALTQNTGY